MGHNAKHRDPARVGGEGNGVRATVATLLLLVPAACGGGMPQRVEDPQNEDASFVFGYVDMTDGPCWLS